MGYENYSHAAHAALANSRAALPAQRVFTQTACHPLMDPRGVRVRESRDSDAHPNSLGVVFALDVTGSMGQIPVQLARTDLPRFMKLLLDCGVQDPQLLFAAVGDATCDRAPLQVGQFESGERAMDQWLTWSYLEGGGGGQITESYELALYFLAQHTDMDCYRKRNKRGYLFMTGDELPYPAVSKHQVDAIVGDRLDEDVPVEAVVAELQRTFHPFFLVPDAVRAKRCEARWRELLGDHVVCMESPDDTCLVAAGLLALTEGVAPDLDAFAASLAAAGTPRERVASTVRALAGYAALLGRGGGPEPTLDASTLPRGDGASGWRRDPRGGDTT